MTAAESARSNRMDRVVRWGALGVGVVLFSVTLYYIDVRIASGTIRHLGFALPLALLFSGLWHLVRTWAWAWCFPQPRRVSFARLARIRLAAEAFSYLTLRGIAGEPLKVVLLGDQINAREATAAVALERIAYLVGTTMIVGVGSVLALVGLPLSHLWFRIFRAFAIAAGVVTLFSALVITGRGTYFQSWLLRIDAALGTAFAQGRLSRFISAVERQMLDLVRGSPARLVVLLTATVAAYVCMALEAWVILRATGAITPNGALAVETFSRVASFASAFIPANLGALEASSLAAVTAVGAASGGAALALARRLRGLFWAGIGLAIYPRRARTAAVDQVGRPRSQTPTRPTTLLYFPYDAAVTVPPSARIAGLPLVERVLRPAQRAGYTHIVVWLPPGSCAHEVDARLARFIRNAGPTVVIARNHTQWRDAMSPLAPDDAVTAIGAGTIVSTALLVDARDLAVPLDGVRDVPAGPEFRITGLLRVPAALVLEPENVAAHLAERRERAAPLPSGEAVSEGVARLAMRVTSASDLPAAEETLRRSSYKATDALIARWNRRVSLPISIALIPTPLTANQLSVMLVGIGLYAGWLFGTGHYLAGVVGAFLSLAASVLDGCDGEIARLKYEESALGCWIETFGDYSYYIAIFIGLTIGAVRNTGWEGFYWLGGAALTGLLITFGLLIYLRTRITEGQPEQLHSIARKRFKSEPTIWSRVIWRIQFVATRAAMPYGIMALALVGLLPVVVVLAAIGSNVYWISIIVKLRDLLGAAEETVAA